MKKFDWSKVAQDLIESIGGVENIKSFQHCATRFRFYAKDDKKVSKQKINEINLVKGINKDDDQWQVIFGAGTVNKVHDAVAKITSGNVAVIKVEKKPLWNPTLSFRSNFFTILRAKIRGFADIFIPLIPVFIAGGLCLALESLIIQVDPNSSSGIGAAKFFNLIGGAVLGSLPAFVGYTAMKKFGGNPLLGLAIGIIMVAPSLLNGWNSSSNYIIVGFGKSESEINLLKTNYIIEHFPKVFANYNAANSSETLIEFAKGHKLIINEAFALFPNAPAFFSFSFIGYQAQVFPTLGIIYLAYWVEKLLKKISHESIAIVSVPLGTLAISIFLGFLIVGPAGRYVGIGITTSLQSIYKYTNWPGFGLGGAIIGALYPLLVVTGLHQGFVPVEAAIIAETSTTFGHAFTWITPIATVSNVSQAMVGLTLAFLLWKKSPKAGSTALSGSVSANLGITEPILFGVNLPLKYAMISASIASAFGGYYVGMTHTVANSLGSASWLGLVQFDFKVNPEFQNYLKAYNFKTTPGLDKIAPGINQIIALGISSVAACAFTLLFTKTFGKKSFNEFIENNMSKNKA